MYFGGSLNDRDEIGRIDTEGALSWHAPSPIDPREVHLFGLPFAGIEELLVVVGFQDSISRTPCASVALYDVDGGELSVTVWNNSDFSTWINDIDLISTTATEAHFVAAGGAVKDGADYPYLARITILSDWTVRLDEDKVLLGDPGWHFWWLTWNGSVASPRYFGSVNSTSDRSHGRVVAVSDSFEVAWAQAILPSGATSVTLYELEYSGGSVYAVGSAQVPRGDGHTRNGVVAAVSEAGNLEWESAVAVSDLADGYFGCAIDQGALYAAGETASFQRRSNNRVFGNALLSKFSLPSGTPCSTRASAIGTTSHASCRYNHAPPQQSAAALRNIELRTSGTVAGSPKSISVTARRCLPRTLIPRVATQLHLLH